MKHAGQYALVIEVPNDAPTEEGIESARTTIELLNALKELINGHTVHTCFIDDDYADQITTEFL